MAPKKKLEVKPVTAAAEKGKAQSGKGRDDKRAAEKSKPGEKQPVATAAK